MLKAFNTIYFEHLRDRGRPDAPAADRTRSRSPGTTPRRRPCSPLIDEIGFTAVNTGTLAESWRQEPDSPVYGAEVPPDQAVALIAEATR